MIKKILVLAGKHKIISGMFAFAVIGGGYYAVSTLDTKSAGNEYVTAAVERGVLMTTISGTGQVSASTQLEIKLQASGKAVAVYVKNGQEVKAGALLAQLDSSDAYKTVRDAELNLESAKLSLQKLIKPADNLSLTQAENSLASAEDSKKKAEDDLVKAYDDGFNAASNAFLDLPSVMTGLHDTFFTGTILLFQWNVDYYADGVKAYDEKALVYKKDVNKTYQAARTAYDSNYANYKNTSRFSDKESIEKLINETYETSKTIAEAIKSGYNLIQFYKDKLSERGLNPNAAANGHLSSLDTYTGKVNSQISALLSIKNSIYSNKQAIISATRTVAERKESLAKLNAGADALDIKSQELTLRQRESSLLDAKANLSKYAIRAPIGGVITGLSINKGDDAGTGTTLATVISKQKLAEVSLNEVDVAKVKVGQKATLTFDAVDNLSLTGQVAEVDALGTVSQGVVSYNAKIIFDTQDERVKSGMSVAASIITEVKQEVLLAPNSAVKTSGVNSYVEVLINGVPVQKIINIGLANDTVTEISGDIKEGDEVVTQTITTAAKITQPNALQNFGGVGRAVGGGGATFRTGR